MIKRVAASEYDILTITRGLVGQESLAALEGLLRRTRKIPDKLGPTAMGILQDTLAKGVVGELARRGGWRPNRFLKDGEPSEGRTWVRHTAPTLHFSAFSIRLIRWLVSAPVGNTDCPKLGAKPKTLADEVLMYLALDLTSALRADTAIVRQPAFRNSGLCWLGFPNRLSREDLETTIDTSSFTPWFVGDGPLILELLQQDLTLRWAAMEWGKQTVRHNAAMLALGEGQQQVSEAFLEAANAAERRDLALFLIKTATELLRGHAQSGRWIDNLELRGAMRVRTGARQAAGAFLRSLRTLHDWAEESGAVRFFDDEYEAAQLYLTQWEALGDDGFRHSERIIRELEALDAGVATLPEAQQGDSQ